VPKIRETETTFVLLLGAMTNFITKRAAGPQDRDHPLKKVIIAPLSEDAPAFAARFGVETYTIYNMTGRWCRNSIPARSDHAGGRGRVSRSGWSTSTIAKSSRVASEN
jgi:hypothetical protein